MNTKALTTATIIGTVLQLIMVIGGHFVPAFGKSDFGFAIGGTAISLVAGLLYARAAAGAWGSSLIGGAIAGAACAVVGVAVSILLGDVPVSTLAIAAVSSGVTGLIGGAVGKLIARAPA